jgi:hypothetical protein
MSTIVPSRSASETNSGGPLSPRGVRLRNVCLRSYARRRGIRAPSSADFAALDEHTSLKDAARWWEMVVAGGAGGTAVPREVPITRAERPRAFVRISLLTFFFLLASAVFPAAVR